MQILKYYCKLVHKAVGKPFKWATGGAFFLSIIGAIFSLANPETESTIELLSWVIPLTILVSFVFAGILIAPYLLYKEERGKHNEEKDRIIKAKDDEYYKVIPEAQLYRVHKVFCDLFKWGEKLENVGPEQIQHWDREIRKAMSDYCDKECLNLYLNGTGRAVETKELDKRDFEQAMEIIRIHLEKDFRPFLRQS